MLTDTQQHTLSNTAAAAASSADVEPREARLHRRLIETTAELCAAKGYRRIVLGGTFRDLSPIVRQPWAWHNVEVVGIVSPTITVSCVRGVPVVAPTNLPEGTDAIVICSEACEHPLREHVAPAHRLGIPILHVHHEQATWEEPATAIERLTRWDISVDDARWLVENRGERHDATLPMLLPRRTELHLRRYEFASAYTKGKRVADVASGTGYGSRTLMTEGGAASVVGIDVDARAVAYAQRRFARDGVSFRVADGAATGLVAASIDVVTSFETIEHVADPRALLAEFARLLTPGGKLVLSTPNDWGMTDYHVQSFTPATLGELLKERYVIDGWWTQLDSGVVRQSGLPEGIAPMASFDDPAETILVVATVKY